MLALLPLKTRQVTSPPAGHCLTALQPFALGMTGIPRHSLMLALLWLRSKWVTLWLSASPEASMRALSSSNRFPASCRPRHHRSQTQISRRRQSLTLMCLIILTTGFPASCRPRHHRSQIQISRRRQPLTFMCPVILMTGFPPAAGSHMLF